MELMMKLGETLTEIGLYVTPISFIAYLILSYLQYIWYKIHYSKAVKSLWYLAVFIGEITQDARFYVLVLLMIFMDCTDSLFEFLEERREAKK